MNNNSEENYKFFNHAVVQFGTNLIRIDLIKSISYTWNAAVNEKNKYAYIITVVYNMGESVSYNGNIDDLRHFLVTLSDYDYFDNLYVIHNIEDFIKELHQQYYDSKAFNKINQKMKKSSSNMDSDIDLNNKSEKN
jgi:hypothetical protein